MKISNASTTQLVKYILGDEYAPYRSGTQLLKFFNEYGGYDFLPSDGLPKMPNSEFRYSRGKFVEKKLVEMNGTGNLRTLLEALVNQLESPDAINEIYNLLKRDSFSLEKENGMYVIRGGIIDKTLPVVNTAHFVDNERQVIDTLCEAKVSIIVAMAWFTSERIKEKLIEKKKEGVDIELIIYADNINQSHGVDLSELSHIKMKGSRGGIMHNKFCVIDNQIVITGSYNWTKNAETRNDENVTILKDPKSATKYSLEFKRLKECQRKKELIIKQ